MEASVELTLTAVAGKKKRAAKLIGRSIQWGLVWYGVFGVQKGATDHVSRESHVETRIVCG